jgi:hypothetical protein
MFGFQNLGVMIMLLVTGPFILIMLVLIIVLARSARKASATKRWPVSNGRILSSDVTSHRSLDSNGTHSTFYEPQVVYEYAANGQTFQSKQVSFGAISGMSGTGWAEGIVGKYPTGSAVQVFYNPSKPSQAVLEHGGAGGNTCLMLVFIGIEAILVGIVLAAVAGKIG